MRDFFFEAMSGPNLIIVASVLQRMHDGVSLRSACEAEECSPSTFLLWVSKDKDLAEQYAHARACLLDAQAEELEEIGERAASAESAVEVAGLRLQSDNRKWLLSKLAPKKYGDRLELDANHSGSVAVDHGVTAETAALLRSLSVDNSAPETH